MCGLVGVAGAIGLKEEGVFKTLLKLDVIRGEDSTGIASLSSFGLLGVYKEAVNSIEFLSSKKSAGAFYGVSRILLGHNRAATKGKIIDENAHPFTYGNITGAHNGTLNSWATLLDGKRFDVDSQAVFHHMSEEGVTDLWGKLNGAAALTWIHKKRNSINFLRNEKRDLHYTYSKDGKTLFWASEPWMLYVALSRGGVEFGEIEQFKVNTHYEFFADKNLELKVRELAPYVFVYKPATTGLATSLVNANRRGLSPVKIYKKDYVTFEVELIRDFIGAKGSRRCNVIGTSTAGLPVRIWNVEVGEYEGLIHLMSTENGKFKGRAFEGAVNTIDVDIETVFSIDNFMETCVCGECNTTTITIDAHQQRDGSYLCDECQLDVMYRMVK